MATKKKSTEVQAAEPVEVAVVIPEMEAPTKEKRVYPPGTTPEMRKFLEGMHRKFPKAATLGVASQCAIKSVSTPTGSVSLDWGTGKRGVLQNKIIEFYGPPSQGKTLTALQMIVEQQKRGKWAAYCDIERSHDEEETQAWMAQQGVNLDMLIYIRDTAERTMDMIHYCAENPDVGIIVLDSVASLTLNEVAYKDDMGKNRVKSIASLMNNFLGKFNVLTKGADLVIINQVRAAMSAGGVGFVVYDTPCGWALKHYAHLRVEVRGERLLDEIVVAGDKVKVQIGIEMTLRIVKNKMGSPFKKAIVRYYFKTGMDTIDELFNLAIRHRLFEQRGAWYTYERFERNADGSQGALLFRLKENGQDAMMHALRMAPDIVHKTLYDEIMAARDESVEFTMSAPEELDALEG